MSKSKKSESLVLRQHASKTFPGLQVVINHQDGSVWATQSAIARLIDKHKEYVRLHEETMVSSVKDFTKLAAEVLTEHGLRSVKLYDIRFISSIVLKYNPDLYEQAALAGLTVYFYGLAGYAPEVAAAPAQRALSSWREVRDETKAGHQEFVRACRAKRHPGAKVHDLITKLITGYTADEARQLPLVDPETDETIGLNHQPSDGQLAQIALAKQLYCGYTKGSWQDQCRRAVFQACPD